MAGDFQRQFNEAIREAELDDVKKQVDKLGRIDPMADLRKTLTSTETGLKADLKKVDDSIAASLAKPDAVVATPKIPPPAAEVPASAPPPASDPTPIAAGDVKP
jgi:sec-independent protein translocase protein TatB